MRYSRAFETFWTGRTGIQIRRLGRDAQSVALYLLFPPGGDNLGIFPVSLATLCSHVAELSDSAARAALEKLAELDFAHWDEDSEEILVVNMAAYQYGPELGPATDKGKVDNRHKYVVRRMADLRRSVHFGRWYDRYRVPFQLPPIDPEPNDSQSKGVRDDSIAPSKGVRRGSGAPSKGVVRGSQGAMEGVSPYSYSYPDPYSYPIRFFEPGAGAPAEQSSELGKRRSWLAAYNAKFERRTGRPLIFGQAAGVFRHLERVYTRDLTLRVWEFYLDAQDPTKLSPTRFREHFQTWYERAKPVERTREAGDPTPIGGVLKKYSRGEVNS